MSKIDSPFEIALGAFPAGTFRVASFRGRERLSRPYAFEVAVTGRDVDADALLNELIGRPVLLTLHGPGGSRVVRGVVARAISSGAVALGRAGFRLRVVPRLALRKHRRNSRIFQDMTVVEVVSAVLGEAGVAHRWTTEHAYPVHGYVVQYEETDLDFMHRLLAENGIYYHFEPPPEDADVTEPETVVFGDRARYAPIDGDSQLLYRPAGAGAALRREERHVTVFERGAAAAPVAYFRRDHDFQRPLARLEAQAMAAPPAGASPALAEVYEHHGHHAEAEAEARRSTTALEQLRRKAGRARGESLCPRLLAGRRFTLHEHEIAGHDGEYVVTQVEHEGRSADVAGEGGVTYENRFSCIPAANVLRPARRAREVRQSLETAVVTGPEGQEIYADAFGRIKVQFRWDREGRNDERSSCWLRVVQPWAGAGWGFQFIPRVGMEVLVSFLGGDPDRPVVMGCLPDATHPPPYPLPENKAKSGIKTESTPGGGGFNELLFNDTRGGELVSIRAERNFTETVLNDHLQTVGHDQTTAVAGKRTTEITGDDTLTVKGGQTCTVRGGSNLSVGGSGQSAYAGARSTSVAGDETLRVGGGQTVIAAAYSHLLIGHGVTEGHGLVYVNGNYRIGTAAMIQLGAATGLTLSCGESAIEILPCEIKVKAPKVTVTAADELLIKGKDHEIAATDHLEIRGQDVRLFAKEGQLLLDENARLNGRLVKLNCDRPKPDKKEGAETGEQGTITFKIETHFPLEAGEPLIAVIATPDGKTVERPVDENMEVSLEGKPGDRFVLLDVRFARQSLAKHT
jgi:type VI secretion system secreted protein VgrG